MGRGPGRRGSGTAMGWRVWIPTSPRCGLVPGNGSQVEAVPCIPTGMEAVMATKASWLCWPEPSVLHAVVEGAAVGCVAGGFIGAAGSALGVLCSVQLCSGVPEPHRKVWVLQCPPGGCAQPIAQGSFEAEVNKGCA